MSLELKIPPVLVTVIAALVMWILSNLIPIATYTTNWNIVLSSLLFCAGSLLALLGVIEFKKHQTTVDPRIPHQTERLVISGIYKISRNPMYLGFLLMLAGWAFFLSHFIAVLMLPVFIIYMNKYQIAAEERWMLEKFGDEFLIYTGKVRRWI